MINVIKKLDKKIKLINKDVNETKIKSTEKEAKNSLLSASLELGVPLKNIKVELKNKGKFWLAEDYHQDFANKNELKYKFYRFSCGRDQRLDKLWKNNARSKNVWSK